MSVVWRIKSRFWTVVSRELENGLIESITTLRKGQGILPPGTELSRKYLAKDYKNLTLLCTGAGKSTRVSKICSPRRGLPSRGRCKSLRRGLDVANHGHECSDRFYNSPTVDRTVPKKNLGKDKSVFRGGGVQDSIYDVGKIINHYTPEGTRKSHPRVHDLRHQRLGKPRRGLQIRDTRMGFPCPFLSVVIASINPIRVSMICNPRRGLPSRGCRKSWTLGWDSLVPSGV